MKSSAELLQSGFTIKQLLRINDIALLDARLLLQHVLNLSRSQLIINEDYELSLSEYQEYRKFADKRASGMPLAYILGYKEFYSRCFHVTPATLIPRPETELLVDMVLKLAKPGMSILDLGTGSGCVAISIKLENNAVKVTATDKYLDTLEVAMHNAAILGAEVEFMQSDWFANINKKYNIIVSNPPYICLNDKHLLDLKYEPQSALTDFSDGMNAIKEIITNALPYMQGYLILEHGYNQGEATADLMLKSGFKDINTFKDYAGLNRITLGKFGL